MSGFPTRIWPKSRGSGTITDEARRAAVALALRTCNRNAARVHGVSFSTIGNWVRAAGHPPCPKGRRSNGTTARWAQDGLPVIPATGFVPEPHRPKFTKVMLNWRATYKRRNKNATTKGTK